LETKFLSSPIVVQCSSIGSVSEKWLCELKASFCPNFPYIEAKDSDDEEEEIDIDGDEDEASTSQKVKTRRSGNGKRRKGGKPENQIPLHFVWPTVDDVANCIDGYNAGTSLCCSQNNMKPFLKYLLNKWIGKQPGRDRVPPHIKTYIRHSANGKELAWAMLTSANLSKAAWGEIQKDASQLQIRNYEIGVLFLPSKHGTNVQYFADILSSVQISSNTTDKSDSENLDNEITVSFPIPYTLPATPYEKEDEPWIWDIPHHKPDIFGMVSGA